MSTKILVWDVPTRVFHWLLVISFVGAFITAEAESFADVHVVLGYTLLGLMAFRILWGFVGTRYARFGSFLFRPAEVIAYLGDMVKGKPAHYVGHNPAGSLAIFAMIGLGIASAVSGVLLYQGGAGEALEELHEAVSYAMLAVVVLHVAGVILGSVMHRENLVRAMVTGFKTAEPDSGIRRGHAWLGAIILLLVVAFWVGYPATGLVTSGNNMGQSAQEYGDDD